MTTSNSSPRRQPSQYDLFTGGKTAELAVFYNMAFFRLAGFLNHLLGHPYTESKDALEKEFDNWLASQPEQQADNDAIFHRLRNYLWKSYRNHKV